MQSVHYLRSITHMVEVISPDRSALAIQVSAVLSNLSNAVCIIAFLAMMHYFKCDINNKINPRIRLSAIAPICTSIATNTWFGVLGNNSIWSFINDIFPFIATHCAFSMRIILVSVRISVIRHTIRLYTLAT